MAGDKAIANPKLEGEFYKGNIPYNESQEVHSADDILLNAMGPGSEYFNGVMDNTEVFFGMVRGPFGLEREPKTTKKILNYGGRKMLRTFLKVFCFRSCCWQAVLLPPQTCR